MELKFSYKNNGKLEDVIFHIYPSQDEKLNYMFMQKGNKVAISLIETTDKITSAGVRKKYVFNEYVRDLTTPIYEYKYIDRNGILHDQTDGYGNDQDKQGPYVDMFKNYLSKIPMIQEYMRAEGIPMPNTTEEDESF